MSQNKQYAAEVLAILLQSSSKNRGKFIELDGIDAILQILSSYRKRDPVKDTDEEEFAENVFDSLICLVEEDSGKSKFVEAEGIELALIMLKEGKFSKPRALRALDHALGGVTGAPACERLVEAAGLKTVFGMFLKKVRPDLSYTNKAKLTALQQENENIEHFLGIFASLLRLLPGGSAPRIRTLAKFMEKDYARIEKLIKLRRDYAARISPVEQLIAKERRTFDEEEQRLMSGEWLSRRLDAGLFSLQVNFDLYLTCTIANNLRLLMLFWRGFLQKMMGQRKRSSHFLPTETRICHWSAEHYKVRMSHEILQGFMSNSNRATRRTWRGGTRPWGFQGYAHHPIAVFVSRMAHQNNCNIMDMKFPQSAII